MTKRKPAPDDAERVATIPAQIAEGRGRPALDPATAAAIEAASAEAGFPISVAAAAEAPSTPAAEAARQDPEA